jgi:hypothetical protein
MFDSNSDDDAVLTVKAKPSAKKIAVVVKQEPGASVVVTDGPVAQRRASDHLPASSARPRNARSTAHDLLSRISSSLDPSTQMSRSEDRATRTLQTTQLLTLSNQLRDAQATIEGLRNRVQEADRERHASERRADRAEFMSMLLERRDSDQPVRIRQAWRRGRRYRQEVVYADGGRATQWIGSEDEDRPGLPREDSPGTRRYGWYDNDVSTSGSPRIVVPRHQSVFHGVAGSQSPRRDNRLNPTSPMQSDNRDLAVTVTPTRGDRGISFTITPRRQDRDEEDVVMGN